MWSVEHRGEEGALNIVRTGKVPKSYAAIEADLIDAQKAEGGESANVDHVFDLPLVLAKQTVGFRHDEDSEPPGAAYEILEFNYRHRLGLTIRKVLPWLYFLGILVLPGVAMIAAVGFGRRLILWILKLLK